MKKIKIKLVYLTVFVALIVVVLIKGGFLKGIWSSFDYIIYNRSDNVASSSDASVSDAGTDTENSRDARYIEIDIVSNLKPKEEYYGYSNAKQAWWFKRDTEHGPSGCDDVVDIDKYGGYYLNPCKCGIEEAVSDKVLYLTFDCGYENGYTDTILDVLKEENVPACFFVTQTFIRDNLELVKRMKQEGHQVGNHTITHPSLPERSYEEIVEEITGCAEYMKEATGYNIDPYLRPPKGEYSERTLAITNDLGYKTIFWSMAYLDYDVNNQPGANYVVEHFEKYHHSGAIILMHNVSSSNAGALRTVIENMKRRGYRFASLNELWE